jgi:hypothetical protein
VPARFARARFWPGIVAVILIASMLLPPAASDARQYLFVQALQFVIFAVAGPALLVRPSRSPPAWPGGPVWGGRGYLAAAGYRQRAGPPPRPGRRRDDHPRQAARPG